MFFGQLRNMNLNILLFVWKVMSTTFPASTETAPINSFILSNALKSYAHPSDDTKSLMDKLTPVPFDKFIQSLGERLESIHANTADADLSSRLPMEEMDIFENLGETDQDLRAHVPVDFRSDLSKYELYRDDRFSQLFSGLNNKWLELSKEAIDLENNYSTLINTKIPFFVPGGRFREFYYWDNYWILKGLLRMDMDISAVNVIRNMIFMIDSYGFIPNGARLYYTGRTQPPFFVQMIHLLYLHNPKRHGDFVLNVALRAALTEYDWLEKNRRITFYVGDQLVHLSQYRVSIEYPRPESFKEDLATFEQLRNEQGDASASEFYSHIHSAAESGWDFSTRWEKDDNKLHTIHTVDFVPADLNAIMYKNEVILSELLEIAGDSNRSADFKQKAAKRARDMQIALWNPKQQIWNDYDIKAKKPNDKRFYFSNIMPLLYGVLPPEEACPMSILLKYHEVLFGYIGGIPAGDPVFSELGPAANQQWDGPNVWAPHQSMLVDYLLATGHRKLAIHAARSFFENVNVGFMKLGIFFEKYSSTSLGLTGEGGEYDPQTGFGWTNGCIIDFIFEFHKDFQIDFDHQQSANETYEYIRTHHKCSPRN